MLNRAFFILCDQLSLYTMKNIIPAEIYQEIESMIASEKSVVGIDAKHTHILILYKLMEIEKRLDKLEANQKKS